MLLVTWLPLDSQVGVTCKNPLLVQSQEAPRSQHCGLCPLGWRPGLLKLHMAQLLFLLLTMAVVIISEILITVSEGVLCPCGVSSVLLSAQLDFFTPTVLK